MDELEVAVLLCLDPTSDPSARQKALSFCQQVREAHDGWKYVLQKLSCSMRPEVAFWCLQVLHEVVSDPNRYPAPLASDSNIDRPAGSLTKDECAAFRGAVLQYCESAMEQQRQRENNSAKGTETIAELPPFLLNKVAQLIAALIAVDYPENWPDAFQGIILPFITNQSKSSDASTRMFFRFLRALDDDVTSIRATQQSARARLLSTRVKDAMRVDCVPALVSLCAQLMGNPKFISHALDFIARYVEWIDINLVLVPTVLDPIYGAIKSVSPCPARAAAAVALRAIVVKRMHRNMKCFLLDALNVTSLLQSIPTSQQWNEEEESADTELNLQDGRIETARLVNAIAMESMEISKSASKGKDSSASFPSQGQLSLNPDSPFLVDDHVVAVAGKIAEIALPVGLHFIRGDSEDVTSMETLQCVTNYVNTFARSKAKNKEELDGGAPMAAILHVLGERARFPKDYDPYSEDNSTEHPFPKLRQILIDSVFRGIARALPSVVLSFIDSLAVSNAQKGDIVVIELILTLLTAMCSCVWGKPELLLALQSIMRNPPSAMAISSDLIRKEMASGDQNALARAHQIEAMSVGYFDLMSRACRIFLDSSDPSLLAAVLPVFFDERGLAHRTSETIRSQAAHYLLKLTRPLRSAIAKAHLDDIILVIKPRLLPVLEDINSAMSQDQMVLFEIIGYLLGHDQKEPRTREYLPAFLTPIINGLQSQNPMAVIAHIMAAGQLSKGFGGDSSPVLLVSETNKQSQSRAELSNSAQSEVFSRSPSSGVGPNTYLEPKQSTDTIEIKAKKVGEIAPDLRPIWVKCLEAVLHACTVHMKGAEAAIAAELRAKLLFFLHRMVDTIGSPVLPFLSSVLPELLRSSASAVDTRDAIILTSQAVTKFQSEFRPVAASVYLPIVHRVLQVSYEIDSKSLMSMSEVGRENVELQRAYHYFLDAVVGSGLISILLEAQNVDVLQVVVESVLATAIGEKIDIRCAAPVMKMALNILKKMADNWSSQGASSEGSDAQNSFDTGSTSRPPGFDQFLIDKVAPACVLSGLRGTVFRHGDYSSHHALAVIGENVALQHVCATRLGPVFGESMRSKALSSISTDIANQYLNALYAQKTVVGQNSDLPRMFISLLSTLRAHQSST